MKIRYLCSLAALGWVIGIGCDDSTQHPADSASFASGIHENAYVISVDRWKAFLSEILRKQPYPADSTEYDRIEFNRAVYEYATEKVHSATVDLNDGSGLL